MAPRGPPAKVPRTREEGEPEANVSGSSEEEERVRRVATRAGEEAPSSSGAVAIRPDEQAPVETARSRAGYRSRDLHLNTIPENIHQTAAVNIGDYKKVPVLTNFLPMSPMQERHIYQYRIDFEPLVESVSLRRRLFHEGTENIFSKRPGFDGMHDVYCSQKLDQKLTVMHVKNPLEPGTQVKMTIDRVGDVDWGSPEMLRVYNLHMKNFLKVLGFYQITSTGSWVHSSLSTPIGNGDTLAMVRGFKTSAQIRDAGIMMNLEAVHKLMQRKNVLQLMQDIRAQKPSNLQEAIRSQLTGKLVVTNYNKRVYRIEDVDFTVKPTLPFESKRDKSMITYIDYFKTAYGLTIHDVNQPLLVVIPNNKVRVQREGQEKQGPIHLIPELCNIAGLTELQRTDNRLKMELIRASQIPPNDRVGHMKTFMQQFHKDAEIRASLEAWGYSYDTKPVFVEAHVLPVTRVGLGPRVPKEMKDWDIVNDKTADFNVNALSVAPEFAKMAVLIGKRDLPNKAAIMSRLKQGFDKVGLRPDAVQVVEMNEGDGSTHYVSHLTRLSTDTTAAVVVMNGQNKERYDSIKKLASVERGLITQVVTARLLMDQKKATGASVKIAIQIAAKLGGEPWRVDLPLRNAMVCGYDAHHDTAKRGRSFGAFLASMNEQFSSWFSKADTHDRIDEMSSQIATNIVEAFNMYKRINKQYPDRVFIYRDGVSDGQIEHVYRVELQKIIAALKSIHEGVSITMITVNKRTGARFYMKVQQGFTNPPPATVIDKGVTRKQRYDFYLISQSTRQGTVTPTYYNIIHDESGLAPERHQMMAFKFCLLYYNWSGSVRVPAPCQYAHKLAFLCGEHLHSPPNTILNDRLHFL